MTPLDAREWLEMIVRTGAQRSGFAADALAVHDAHEQAERDGQPRLEMLDEVVAQLEDAPGLDVAEQAEWVGRQFDKWSALTGKRTWSEVAEAMYKAAYEREVIVKLLEGAGVVAVGDVPDDLVGLLAMFVHD